MRNIGTIYSNHFFNNYKSNRKVENTVKGKSISKLNFAIFFKLNVISYYLLFTRLFIILINHI